VAQLALETIVRTRNLAAGVEHARRICRCLDVREGRTRGNTPNVWKQRSAQSSVAVFACKRPAQARGQLAGIQQGTAHAVAPSTAVHFNQRIHMHVSIARVSEDHAVNSARCSKARTPRT
jgi:hypothetical protein